MRNENILRLVIKSFLLFIFIGNCNVAYSQEFGFSGGVSYEKQFLGESGLLYGTALYGPCTPIGYAGTKLSTEFNFNSNRFLLGPKLSCEFDFALFGARLSVIDYTDFKLHDLRFSPEVGLTCLGVFGLYYGWNIPLTSERIEWVSSNRITFIINIDKELFDNL